MGPVEEGACVSAIHSRRRGGTWGRSRRILDKGGISWCLCQKFGD